jgi:hypothetical protein
MMHANGLLWAWPMMWVWPVLCFMLLALLVGLLTKLAK